MRNKNFTLSEFKSDGRYEMDTTAKSASSPPISPVTRTHIFVKYYKKFTGQQSAIAYFCYE